MFPYVVDSQYLPYTFKGMNNAILECNFDEEILEKNVSSGKIIPLVRNRVIRSHLSLQTLKQALLENDLRNVVNIVLIHLSSQNSNAERFKKEISDITGKRVEVASKGLQIDFNKEPF